MTCMLTHRTVPGKESRSVLLLLFMSNHNVLSVKWIWSRLTTLKTVINDVLITREGANVDFNNLRCDVLNACFLKWYLCIGLIVQTARGVQGRCYGSVTYHESAMESQIREAS